MTTVSEPQTPCLVGLSDNDPAECNIIDAFHRQQWTGAVSLERAIQSVLQYRQNLSEEDRTEFDAEVQRGRHPSVVVETFALSTQQTLQRPAVQRASEAA